MMDLEQAARAVTRDYYQSRDIRPALSALVLVLVELDRERDCGSQEVRERTGCAARGNGAVRDLGAVGAVEGLSAL